MTSRTTAAAIVAGRLAIQNQVDRRLVESAAAVQTVKVEGVADVILVHFAHIAVVGVVAEAIDPRRFPET